MFKFEDFSEKNSWNVLSLLRERADELGEKKFIEFDSGKSLSFRSLEDKSSKLALKLRLLGLKENDNVFCFLKNCPELLVSLFAIMKAGGIFVPINTELRGKFLSHQYTNSNPKIVIVNHDLVEFFEKVDTLNQDLLGVVCVDHVPENFPQTLASGKKFNFDLIMNESLESKEIKLVNEPPIHQICSIMYTSGTTGPSKGVLLTHGHFFSFAITSAQQSSLTTADTYYICMPLFHVNGLNMQCLGSLYAGISVYCVERFSPNRWLSDLLKSKATVTNLLGVMPEFVFNTSPSSDDKKHHLRIIMAAPIGKDWGKDFEKRFEIKFLQGFGMTESGMSFWEDLSEDDTIPGCPGYPNRDLYDVKIGNPENDEFLPVNKVGELLIRPRWPGIFSAGYFKMPEKTIEAWRNLWFHTGDACYFDDRGRMHYFDRIKDCIRRRGENISAFELEQVINAYENVIECAAIGVKTEDSGGEDEVLVCIVKENNSELEFDGLLNYCKANLPRFAIPKFVRFVESIKKTGSGKMSKVILREEGLTSDSVLLDSSIQKLVHKS